MSKVIILAIVGLLALVLVVIINGFKDPNQPCSEYADTQLQYVPARCLKELR